MARSSSARCCWRSARSSSIGLRHRWLAPLARPTRAGFVAALRADRPAWIIAAATGLVVLVVLGGNGWSKTPDGWVSGGWNWSDLLVHVAIGSSISAGNFPPEVPYFAGVPLTYHWFADFHGAIASTVAGLDIIPVYFASSALFAAVLALVVWALAIRLTGDRRVASIATILVVAGGGLGWIRLVGDVMAGAGNPLDLVSRISYDNTWDGRLAVLQDRLDLRDRVPAAPGDDPGSAGAGDGRAARRQLPGSPPARGPAGRDPGRAPRAVPVLRLPGDLPHRVPVRGHDRCVARQDGRPRCGAVPGAGRAGRPVHRLGDPAPGRGRGVPARRRLGRGALRRRAGRRRLLLPDQPRDPVRPRGRGRVHGAGPAESMVPRRLDGGALRRAQRRRRERGRIRHEQVLPDHVDRGRDPRRLADPPLAEAADRGRPRGQRPVAGAHRGLAPALEHRRASGSRRRRPPAGSRPTRRNAPSSSRTRSSTPRSTSPGACGSRRSGRTSRTSATTRRRARPTRRRSTATARRSPPS